MDTKAYLMSQGWSGPGSPLNPTTRRSGSSGHTHRGLGQGLSKPILVSRKDNTFGVGKKATHDHTNQWWLRGFEEALRGVGTDGSSTPTSTSGAESSAAPAGEEDGSELYKYFVRGQGLPGTFSRSSRGQEGNTPKRVKGEEDLEKGKKRKRDDEGRSTRKERHKKIKPVDGVESMEVPTGNEDMILRETGTKLKKQKNKVTKKNKQPSDSIEDQRLNNVEDSVPEGKTAEKKNGKEKRRKRKRAEEAKLPAEDIAEGTEDKGNRTSNLPIIDDDERRRLKTLKKLAKKSRREEKNDRSTKSKKRKSKKAS